MTPRANLLAGACLLLTVLSFGLMASSAPAATPEAQLQALCAALGAPGEVTISQAPPGMGGPTLSGLAGSCDTFSLMVFSDGSMKLAASAEAPFNQGTRGISRKSAAEKAARKFIADYGPKLGLQLPLAEMQITLEREDTDWFVSLVRFVGEVPALPECELQFDEGGALRNLSYSPPGEPASLQPKITKEQAAEALLKALGKTDPIERLEAELRIARWAGKPPALGWELTVFSAGKALAIGVVDAVSGEVLVQTNAEGPMPSPGGGGAPPAEPVELPLWALIGLAVLAVLLIIVFVKLRKR